MTETSTGNHAGTVNYSYDQRDQLTAENATAYSYDNNGNLTAKIGEAGYTWDFENRLTRVALLDGTTVDHVYDADGNRVKTTVTPPSGTGTAIVTNYLVDTTGNLSQVVAETDGTGALKALYVRAHDELLAVMRPTGTSTWATRYVHADGLGSVRVLTDEAGVVTDTRDYEAFGTRNESTGSDSLAFGFAGEQFDSLARLAYHRARWMDSRTGRFLGMDPKEAMLQRPGKFHLYLYAGANPIGNVDPTGQEGLATIGAGIAGGAILATAAIAGYSVWKDHSGGKDMIVTVINTSNTEGAAAALIRVNEIDMSSVSTMVYNIRAKVGNNRMSRLNILDHGNETGMSFGSDWIDSTTFAAYERELRQLQDLFAPDGFAQLQGCNVGQNQELIRQFASALNVPVYAGTGIQNPIFRVNSGTYVRCEPSGICTGGAAAP